MRNSLLAVAMLTALLPLHAQDSKESGLYKVEINFRDATSPEPATDRRYTLLVTDSERAIVKAGSRNPTVSGSVQPQTAGAAVSTQFTYLDVGVNIDCFVQRSGSKALFRGSLDLSNAVDGPMLGGVRNPTIRQTRLDVHTMVEFGKPTVVASIDDPVTSRHLQVEATITKAN